MAKSFSCLLVFAFPLSSAVPYICEGSGAIASNACHDAQGASMLQQRMTAPAIIKQMIFEKFDAGKEAMVKEPVDSSRVTSRTILPSYQLESSGPELDLQALGGNVDLRELAHGGTNKLLPGTVFTMTVTLVDATRFPAYIKYTKEWSTNGIAFECPRPLDGAWRVGDNYVFQTITDKMYKLAPDGSTADIPWASMSRMQIYLSNGEAPVRFSNVTLITPMVSRVILPSMLVQEPGQLIENLTAAGGATDLTRLVDPISHKLLSGTTLSMTVNLADESDNPAYFKYTRDWSTNGFALHLAPTSGAWQVGDNYVSQAITDEMYKLDDGGTMSDIPWASMIRLHIYIEGSVQFSNIELRTSACREQQIYLPSSIQGCQPVGCCVDPPGALPGQLTALPQHPRVRMTSEDFDVLHEWTQTDATATQYCSLLMAYANRLVTEGPRTISEIECIPANMPGKRLLSESRLVLDHLTSLALAFQLSKREEDPQTACGHSVSPQAFADLAIQHMLHVTGPHCVGWNAQIFLDAAEMLYAVGLGFDWLYDEMTGEQRQVVASGALRNGLQPGLDVYGAKNSETWPVLTNNWNLVCNGALIVGALAFADMGGETQVVSTKIYRQALASIPTGLSSYVPDGGWYEGPSYWSYGTSYAIAAMSSLQTALGTDGGLAMSPGFKRTGLYRIDSQGNADFGRFFNFADSTQVNANTWHRDVYVLYGLARVLAPTAPNFAKAYAYWARRKLPASRGFSCLAASCVNTLMMYRPDGTAEDLKEVSGGRTSLYRMPGGIGDDVGFMRESWDTSAAWLGFKGGWAIRSHADADAGSFVLDMVGKTWVIDLGSDNYNIHGYFGWEHRAAIYRKATCGHNTLTFDQASDTEPTAISASNQVLDAVGKVQSLNEASLTGVLDMSPVYPLARKVTRKFIFQENFKELKVIDVIENGGADNVTWAIHTQADVSVNGTVALLNISGVVLYAKIISPPSASFQSKDVDFPEPQLQPTDGPIRKLSFVVAMEAAANMHIIVSFATKMQDEETRELSNEEANLGGISSSLEYEGRHEDR